MSKFVIFFITSAIVALTIIQPSVSHDYNSMMKNNPISTKHVVESTLLTSYSYLNVTEKELLREEDPFLQ